MKALKIFVAVGLLALVGCTDRVGEIDSGGVALEVEFTDSVFRVAVNETDLLSLPTVNINSVLTNSGGASSSLMDIELNTIEITYSRADTGTRAPVPFVYNVVGTVPAGGELTYTDLPVMTLDQLRGPPLSDLLFQNGARDSETGASVIKINLTMRVFGKTVAGVDVASVARTQTFEFVPSSTTSF